MVQPFDIIPIVKCKGCGVTLQYDDPNQLGYTPKKDSEYCQRCFRLSHYGDQMVSLKTGIDPDRVVETIQKTKGTLVWVVDGLDIDHGFMDDFNALFSNRSIVLVVTKTDLLVDIIDPQKYYGFIMDRLKSMNISVDGLIVTGDYGLDHNTVFLDQLKPYAVDSTLIFAGRANAGKSTLLNGLLNQKILTTSRYPGTTIDFNPIHLDNGLTIIDTPGIENSESILQAVDDSTIKALLPTKPIKPSVYQCYSPQSYSIGGLMRIDIVPQSTVSIVMYLENNLKIHRTPLDNAKKLWSNHLGTLLKPWSHREYETIVISEQLDGHDLCINGLGWMSFHGQTTALSMTLPKQVSYTIRKRMI